MGWRRRGLASIGLGVLCTIAIAWWPEVRHAWRPTDPYLLLRGDRYESGELVSHPLPNEVPPRNTEVWRLERVERATETRVSLTRRNLGCLLPDPSAQSQRDFHQAGRELGDMAAEARAEQGKSDPNAIGLLLDPLVRSGAERQWHWTGWPCRSMSWQRMTPTPGLSRSSLSSGIEVLPERRVRTAAREGILFEPVVLPVRPVLPGFAINSLLFGMMFVVPVELAGWVVRERRSRRGRCGRCGYDRLGLPAETACPECGSAGRTGKS